MRRRLLLLLTPLLLLVGVGPVGAQEDPDLIGAVDISYDVGDFDGERGDWPITVVYVSGDLDEGEPFTVYLGDDEGELWSATQPFVAPTTAVTVEPFVAVGDVTRTAVAQDLPVVVQGDVIVEPPTPTDPQPTTAVTSAPEVQTPPATVAASPPGPTVRGQRFTEVLGQGSSGGGGGLLALSMVLTVILVAILFRTPLPSQATQRWVK